MSQATEIAEKIGNDGMNFKRFDLVEKEARWTETNERGDKRYLFDDDSAIVVCGPAWDVEGRTPFSWAGEE